MLQYLESRKRPTLLSNSNPFWSRALVPFLNVINDKSNRSMSLLDLVDHPKLFWHSTFRHTKLLGKLAFRVFSCPVNSVACERAFSTQNLTHTVSRNSLHS